jgi:hypothetical protein
MTAIRFLIGSLEVEYFIDIPPLNTAVQTGFWRYPGRRLVHETLEISWSAKSREHQPHPAYTKRLWINWEENAWDAGTIVARGVDHEKKR